MDEKKVELTYFVWDGKSFGWEKILDENVPGN